MPWWAWPLVVIATLDAVFVAVIAAWVVLDRWRDSKKPPPKPKNWSQEDQDWLYDRGVRLP